MAAIARARTPFGRATRKRRPYAAYIISSLFANGTQNDQCVPRVYVDFVFERFFSAESTHGVKVDLFLIVCVCW